MGRCVDGWMGQTMHREARGGGRRGGTHFWHVVVVRPLTARLREDVALF